MTKREHTDSYDRLCRDVENRAWWALWGPVVRTVLAGIGLAAALWLVAMSGDCGDLRPAHADPEPAVIPLHPSASQPIPPDPEAFALAARMRAWQPTWRETRPGELEAVAAAIVEACRRDPWPDAARCQDLLGALTFRESSWRADAVGARREVGLAQLHGAAMAGETRESAAEPATNLRLALAWLRRSQFMCRLAGKGDVSTALGMYGSGRCRTYRGSRLLERWEVALRDGGGQS